MKSSRLVLIAAVALVAAPNIVSAAGLLPNINPGTIQVINQPAGPGDHNAVVQLPGGSSSGGGPSQEEILQKLKDQAGKARPLVTTSSGGRSSSSGGTPADGGGAVKINRDYALVCAVSQAGQVTLANRGTQTMPSGVHIKWKAGDRTGFLRLNIDLEPGASAPAPHMTESETCWATVI